MNKYEFKRMLKDLIRVNGLNWVDGSEQRKRKFNSIVDEMEKDPNFDSLDNDEFDQKVLEKYFDVNSSFKAIDPRAFSTYMNSILQGNTPDTELFDFYKSTRDPEDVRMDFSGASDIFPDEMAGYKDDPKFYNKNYIDKGHWAGVETFKNQDGSINLNRGLPKILKEYDIDSDEFLNLLSDEQKKKDLEKIWNFEDPENYESFNSDSWLDRMVRGLVKYSAENFWGNTVNDWKNGKAQSVDNYGVFGGLNTGDLISNGIDIASAPFGGVLGVASDVAIPFGKEVYDSFHNDTDFDWAKALSESAMRVGGRGVASGTEKFSGMGANLLKDKAPKVAEKLKTFDDAIHSQKRVNDSYESMLNETRKNANEVGSKSIHYEDLPQDVKGGMTETEFKTMLEKENPNIKRVLSGEVQNPKDIANLDEWNVFVETTPEAKKIVKVSPKAETDLNNMKMIEEKVNKENPLNYDELKLYRELKKTYPEFAKKVEFSEPKLSKNPTLDGSIKKGVRGVEKTLEKTGVPLSRVGAKSKPNELEIDNMTNSADDYFKLKRMYRDIEKAKPDAVYSATHFGGNLETNKDLSEYEKKVIRKFISLNMLYGENGLK